MKKMMVVATLTWSIIAVSQIKALTETGDEVLLFENKTWQYVDKSIDQITEIKLNAKPFTKSDGATFLIKSSINDAQVYIDPKKWQFTKNVDNPDAEYEFTAKGIELYAMLINEQIELPLATLKSVAIEAARKVAPDLKLVNEEYRMVNGHKVLHLELSGTMQGIKFTYYNYYLSNEKGSTQFVVFSSQNLIKRYKADAEKLVNGLILKK